MRHIRYTILATTAALMVSSPALAEGDIDKPIPNVLLLVDTSGSMEYAPGGLSMPQCTPNNTGAINQKSRWIELIEALTGNFKNYSCMVDDRSSPTFSAEFGLKGLPPYDFGYSYPYHRALSNGCGVGPGTSYDPSLDVFAFPAGAIDKFPYVAGGYLSRVAPPGSCGAFEQDEDGVLDVFRDRARFGLMTFDSHVHPGTGYNSGSGTADVPEGIKGTWSYFLNGQHVNGRPAQCTFDQAQEVGARNHAAPPWEGRLVAFGRNDSDITDTQKRNNWIQEVLMATRPYGGTPLSGLLEDAKQFLWKDSTLDPLDTLTPKGDFGPYRDPAVLANECRKQYIILLSDGEPNLDLRPSCENTAQGGQCPYERPEEIAYKLYHQSPTPNQVVEVAVIGFGMNKVTLPRSPTPLECSELLDSDCASAAPSQTSNGRALYACCTLNKIAAAGAGPDESGNARKALFPKNSTELRQAMTQLLSSTSSTITSRTMASYVNVASPTASGADRFNSGFRPATNSLWQGNLTRSRIRCAGLTPQLEAFDPAKGDDFAQNVASGVGPERSFYSYFPADKTKATSTIRPKYVGLDGLFAETSGLVYRDRSPSTFSGDLDETILDVSAASCAYPTAAQCSDLISDWIVGLKNADDETRCETTGTADCNLLGAIFHSSPAVVPGRPAAQLRQESYNTYRSEMVAKKRPSVLYTSSTDGFLHGFQIASEDAGDTVGTVDSKLNNELWAFAPPAVLPYFKSIYPNSPGILLDGPPVVMDVVATKSSGSALLPDVKYERSRAQAKAGSGAWRTAMLQGFGEGLLGGGYFAVDVTNPRRDNADGPDFLWQLTKDGAGKPLFGRGGVPAIATVALRQGSGDLDEVAVAILPGGDAGTASAALESGGTALNATNSARSSVRGYTDAIEARSITIVRLDSGEIIKTFRPVGHGLQIASDRVITSVIPAPLVGQPIVYSGDVGNVADRAFIGDREGRLLRLNLGDPNPDNWTLSVFYDLYYDLPQGDSAKVQPVILPPVLSVDDAGNVVVIAASGDQRVQAAGVDSINRVVSLTEMPDGTTYRAKLNWVENLGCGNTCPPGALPGERVTGPMTIFNKVIYFAAGTPPSASTGTCATGTVRVWGLHFVDAANLVANPAATPDPTQGGAPEFPDPADATQKLKYSASINGVVFGVGIQQEPTCSTTSGPQSLLPYLGSGQTTSTTSSNPGRFFLNFQVGGIAGSAASGQIATSNVQLRAPVAPVRFASWAKIFE